MCMIWGTKLGFRQTMHVQESIINTCPKGEMSLELCIAHVGLIMYFLPLHKSKSADSNKLLKI